MSSPLTDRPHLAEGLTPPEPRDPFHASSTFASLMLLLLTAFWGLSFSLMKTFQKAAESVPMPESRLFGPTLVLALTTIVLRTGLALPLLLAVRPRFLTGPNGPTHRRGAVLGLVFGAGFTLGVSGLSVISPARSAFLINLTVIFVPLFGWLIFGTRPSRLLIVGAAVCLAGAVVLAGGAVGAEVGVNWGDFVTVGSAVVFALQVVLLDHFAKTHRSRDFTFMFLVATALVTGVPLMLGLAIGDGPAAWWAWLWETCSRGRMPYVAVAMGATTALTLSLMSTYQPRVGANRAAIIYLMEIVFSAFFGVLFGYDSLTGALVLSGALILLGNLIVEAPSFRKSQHRE